MDEARQSHKLATQHAVRVIFQRVIFMLLCTLSLLLGEERMRQFVAPVRYCRLTLLCGKLKWCSLKWPGTVLECLLFGVSSGLSAEWW
jgi:hypothetical protein